MNKYDWYFVILVLIIFILSLLVYFKDFKSEDNYSFEVIKLDNTNIGMYGVVDYMCSDGVETNNFFFSFLNKHIDGYFYASTWRDAKVHYGECFIKVRK